LVNCRPAASKAGEDRVDDGEAGRSGDIADDMLDLQIHLREGFLHVLNVPRLKGVDREFISYGVPFHAALPEGHLDNFYMEREWRTNDDVYFKLSEVRRVVLPANWARSFREAIPEYFGEIIFSG
jgi:hypothetical protein